MTGLDILSHYRNGNLSNPDVQSYVNNLSKLKRRAQQAADILTQWEIPHYIPEAGPNIMVLLPKLTSCSTQSISFFTEFVKKHKIFLELGGIFSQNPEWHYTIARIALGRSEATFKDDIITFCQFYQDYIV
jgi:hypothetical protein